MASRYEDTATAGRVPPLGGGGGGVGEQGHRLVLPLRALLARHARRTAPEARGRPGDLAARRGLRVRTCRPRRRRHGGRGRRHRRSRRARGGGVRSHADRRSASRVDVRASLGGWALRRRHVGERNLGRLRRGARRNPSRAEARTGWWPSASGARAHPWTSARCSRSLRFTLPSSTEDRCDVSTTSPCRAWPRRCWR